MESLTIRRVPIETLHTDPANARTHGERNLESIRASLARFQQVEPLIVRKSTGRVIGGNGRLVAMRDLGWKECDVVELDLDDVQATALGIALNRTAELAEWDLPALGKLLEALDSQGALDGVGFSEDEFQGVLDDILAEQQIELNEDDVPDPPDAATTRRGDIWVIGRHRLMCGDSAEWNDVEKLLAGAKIHLAHQDPPYGVRVEPRSRNAIAAGLSSFGGNTHHQRFDVERHPEYATPTSQMRAKDRPLQNDFLPDEEFAALLRKWFANTARALLPGRCFYFWGGYSNIANYPSALAENGLYFSQAIIWVKGHPVLTRKCFLGDHEWCFFGWREGAAHVFLGPNNITDVWEVKKIAPQKMIHLTEKPVELAARAIQYGSRPGENVLDLFGGSGSSCAAAEQTGRNAFLMELDELYADVIVMRMEKLTGQEAKLEASGETFAQTKAARS